MWGPSIIGFGSYHYKYASGREGDAPAAGFSPRKAGDIRLSGGRYRHLQRATCRTRRAQGRRRMPLPQGSGQDRPEGARIDHRRVVPRRHRGNLRAACGRVPDEVARAATACRITVALEAPECEFLTGGLCGTYRSPRPGDPDIRAGVPAQGLACETVATARIVAPFHELDFARGSIDGGSAVMALVIVAKRSEVSGPFGAGSLGTKREPHGADTGQDDRRQLNPPLGCVCERNLPEQQEANHRSCDGSDRRPDHLGWCATMTGDRHPIAS